MAESKGATWLWDELAPEYKNPVNLAFRPDGREVWAACEASGSVVVVDAAKRVKVAEIAGRRPGHRPRLQPRRRQGVRDEPARRQRLRDRRRRRARSSGRSRSPTSRTGSRVDPSGKTLFVMGTAFDAVSVLDVATGKETKRLPASRNPWSAALSPDGKRLLVTNALSRFVQVPHRADVRGDGLRRREPARSRTAGSCRSRTCSSASPGTRAGSSPWRRSTARRTSCR